MLLTAVLAACVAPAAWGINITGVSGTEIQLGTTALQNAWGYRNGSFYTFSYDGAGTISGLDMENTYLTYKFDIDLDAAAGATNITSKDVTDTSYLIYISSDDTGNPQWGLRLYDGAYTENSTQHPADGTPEIVGHWNDVDLMYKQDSNAATLAELGYTADGGDTQTATVTAQLGDANPRGVALYKGTETTDANKVYGEGGLLTTNGKMVSVTFNTAYVSNFVMADTYGSVQASNAAGTVSKTLNYDDTTICDLNNDKVQIKAGDERLLNGADGDDNVVKKNIVVSGRSQLFLQSWDSGTNLGELTVERDIYIGSTSFNGDAAFSGVALRFGNDAYAATNGGNKINVEGDIYVMEDAKLAANTGDSYSAINITGAVTDIVDGVSANSTLTIKGKGYNISGDVSMEGVVLDSASVVTIGSSSATIGTLTTGGALTNSGSLAVTNTLNLQNAITNSGSLNLSGATIVIDASTTTGSYGYTKATDDVDGNGFLNGSFTVFTNSGDGASATTSIGGVTLYGVAQGTGTYSLSANGTLTVGDTTIYWVNNDTTRTKIASAVAGDTNAEKIVRVTAGKTYDVNGVDAYNKVVLENGATLANLSTTAVGTSENGCNMKQNYYIELLGDANIEATSHFAMVKASHENATLKLNGHTLTKKGNDLFTINSAVADAGTIAITAGGIVLNEQNDTYKSDLDEVAFTMASGTTLHNIDSMTIKSLSSNGGSITVDSGKKLTVAGTLTLGAGTTTQLTSGTLKANNMSVGSGGKLNMATGTVLDLTGITLENTNNGTLDNCIAYASSATTNGTSYVLLAGTGNNNANMSNNVTLTSNVVTSGNLAINGRGWDNSGSFAGYDFTVSGGATLKIGTSGTSKLGLVTKADFIIADAAVIAGVVELGYSGTGANYDAFGTVTLQHKDSRLTAQKIQFQGGGDTTKNTSNALSMSNGTLEFTAEGAVLSGDYGAVNITGGEVVVKKDQSMSTNTNLNVSLSNMAFNIAADKTMALGEGVTTSGEITTKGNGTLRFKGAAAMNKATLDAGSKAVFEKGLTASELSLGESAMLVATTVSELTLTAGAGSAVIKTSELPTTLTSVTVTDSATLQAGGSATGLGASLTMSDGSTLEINGTGGVVLGGALTLGSEINLGSSLVDKIAKLTEGDSLVLFTEVTGLSYSGQTVALMSTEVAPVDAATVFNGLNTGVYEIAFAQDSVSINMLSIPEPTSSMLGLVGLVALTFRRRRK